VTEVHEGLIFEILRMSTEDGPGLRTTVFLCIETCPNGALLLNENGMHIDRDKCQSCGKCVEECPSTALHMWGEWWNTNDLFHEIQKDKIYYSKSNGGITVSGGEPTLQADFIIEFLKKCKKNGISTALDTCGMTNRNTYEKILPFTNLILLDIKEIDSKKHLEFTGVQNEVILNNAIWMAQYVKTNEKELWIRTPIIPNYTATEDNILGIGQFIVNKLKNIPSRWDLLSFDNSCKSKYERLDLDWPLKNEPLMKKRDMEDLVKLAKSTGVKNVHWSGLTRKDKIKLIKKIVEFEYQMFENVRTIQPSSCQENPGAFKLMREMNHSVLSYKTLNSYFNDLKDAKSKERNFMSEKYARMGNLIPPLKVNPLIQEIVSIESEWMNDLSKQYPLSINHNPNYFSKYLSCELETYSDKSIELYLNDIQIAKKNGVSLAKDKFEYLAKKLGYSSLKELESKRKSNFKSK